MTGWNAQYGPELDETSMFSRHALAVDAAAPARLVNRTHRVVRHRARAMQARRSYVRSLLLPLALCSVLLALAAFAVWNGIYQNDAGTAQDVASLATSDTNNHLAVALLWFVPLTLVLLGAVWVRQVRSRESESAQ